MSANLEKRIANFRLNPMGSRELTSVGEAPIDLGLDRAELAAYMLVASTLLNLDETITRE